MALLDSLLSPIFSAINRWLGPLRRLWEKIIQAKDHLLNIGNSTQHLVLTVKNEIEAWRTFKENPRWRSRVVNLPTAFDKTKELIAGIPASWRAIVDLFKLLRDKIDSAGDPKAEADEFAEDLKSGEGISGLLKRVPRIAKGLERTFGFISLAVDALESIANAIDDIQTIVDETARIRGEIESLDTIFLSQSNKRRTEKLADGSSIKIRVGNLHS